MNKSVYILASSGQIDKYSSAPPFLHRFITFTDLFKRHSYSYLADPDLHSFGAEISAVHRSENDIFIPAPLRLSSSHLCAETMTVPVACGAWVPWWHIFAPAGDNNSNSAKRAGLLSGRSPPRASHSAPKASPPPLFAKVRARSAELFTSNCLAGSDCRCYCFLCLVLSPRYVFSLAPASCQSRLPGRFGVRVFKKLKKRGLWKGSWGLGSCTSWIGVFYFLCLLQPKVQSKQCEVNGFIFSCARRSVYNRGPPLFVVLTINANIY